MAGFLDPEVHRRFDLAREMPEKILDPSRAER
jgi:hypothetical protein